MIRKEVQYLLCSGSFVKLEIAPLVRTFQISQLHQDIAQAFSIRLCSFRLRTKRQG